jgi:ferritin-like metal-binding protein YciE
MTTRKDTLASWLKDAHAMKAARIENLERQAERAGEYPDFQRKLQEHLGHSRQQLQELETCLEQTGTDPSSLKEVTSKVASKLQGWTTAAAPDEMVKNVIADGAFAEFEAASFESLAVAADECGEARIAQVCTRMREHERQMADWFRAEIPAVTRGYLARHAQP